MIELKSFPFDSIADDREYPAQIFRNYFHKFLSTGVYFGKYKNYGDYSMKVVQDTGLNVKVTKGAGIIKGLDFELDTDKVLPVKLGGDTARKDMVVVKADDTLAERRTTLYVKEGTATAFATLERTNDIYEICLAKVTVGAGKITIDLDDIEDTRRNEELCGIVTSLIDIDIQDVLDDINLKKNNYFATINNLTQTEVDELISSLEEYVETAQATLDENVAMNLLNLINNTKTELSTSITALSSTKANKKKVYNITLDTTWTGTEAPYTKTIAIEGILATDEPNIKPVWSETLETRQTEKEEYNKISLVTTSAGSLIFTCDEDKPSVSLNLKAEVVY